MKFNPKNFRRITKDSRPSFRIRTNGRTTLILIKGSGEAEYAKDYGGKDRLVTQFDPESDLMLWVWVGQWSTDIFLLSKEDLETYYEPGAPGLVFSLP